MKSLTFNGIRKDWLYLLEGRQKAPFAPITRNLLKIPGRPGALLQSSEIEPLVIYQPIGFVVKNDIDALTKKDELASWLVTMEPVALEFDDEPGRIYYAVVQNTLSDYEKFVRQRRGIIEFLVLDGFGYGPEHEVTFPSDVATLTNEGTAEADPIFELEVQEPVTFAMIQNQDDEYMMIGKPADVDSTIVNDRSLIVNETGGTLDQWQTPSGFTGSFRGSDNGIFVQSYGTGTGWHGPGLIREISPLEDFEIEFVVNARTNSADQTFRISTNFYDEYNNELGMLRLWDLSAHTNHKVVEARVGPYVGPHINYPISSQNYNLMGQLVWYGIIKVVREGNLYTFYVARIDQRGRHVDTLAQTFYDANNEFAGRLRYVRIDIAKYAGTETATEVSIDRISVYRRTKVEEDQTPYIAYPGDIITFDHENADILINGESRMDLKQFGASFFKLKKGENQLVVLPSNSFNVKCSYRPTFL